jgi:putative protein-disulfide isomerase
MVTVHYFFDPMCGWCFGATSLTEIVKNTALSSDNIKIALHPGGMIQRREMNSDFRAIAQQHDKKIEALTGQKFSQKYHNKLGSDETITLDSYITGQAVLVAEQAFGKGLAMLKVIQQAHYVDAIDVSNLIILTELAKKLGIDGSAWQQKMASEAENSCSEIEKNRLLMAQWGVNGFPTFVVENKGEISVLPHSHYYGDPASWQAFINNENFTNT